jgi:hypothetical protein
VDFGASPSPKDPLTLFEFWKLLHQPGPSVDSKNAVDPERVQAVVTFEPRADLEGKRVAVTPATTPPTTILHQIPPPETVETAALKYVLEGGNYPNPPKLGPEPTPTTESGSATGGTTGGSNRTGSTPGAVATTGTSGTPSGIAVAAASSGTAGAPAPTASDPSNSGQGTKWFVKGGSFKFRIETEFALSYASVAAALKPEEDGAGAEVPVLKKGGPHPTKTGIFSRPMKVSTDIISELSVTIMESVSGKIIGGWTDAAFNIKTVPSGTWGQYSTDTDPSSSNSDSLFSHENAVVPLPMGLMLTSPLPQLAQSTIPVFKASDAARMRILDFRFTNDADKANWYVPGYAPIRKAVADAAAPGGLDIKPVSPDLDATSGVALAPTQVSYTPAELTEAEKGKTNQQLWDGLGADWVQHARDKKSLVNDATDGLLARIEDIFGWAPSPATASSSTPAAAPATVTAPATVPTTGTVTTGASVTSGTAGPTSTPATAVTSIPAASSPWQLKGDFPAKLVRSAKKDGTVVKGLEANYLALPRRATVPPATVLVH